VLLGRAAHQPPPGGVGRGPRSARAADRVQQLVVETLVGGKAGLLVAGAEGGVAPDPAQDRAAVDPEPLVASVNGV
jgi:hypothetical protein